MFGSISLVHGFLPPVLVVLALASLVLLLQRRSGVWKRQLLIGLPVTAAIVGVAAMLVDGLSLIPYQFPNSYYLWFGLVILGIVVSIVGWRPFGIGRRLLAGTSLVLTVSMAAMLVNAEYQYYPTVSSLFGVHAHEISAQEAQAAQQASDIHDAAQRQQAKAALEQARIALAGGNPEVTTHGATVQVTIPPTKSGFHARPAYIWLPPVWFTEPLRPLPVIELLAGVPGAPSDWTRAAFADKTASAYAQAHDGIAPILVMPDANGSVQADTECVDSPLGQAETYLTVDVPAYLRSTFGAETAPDSMAIGGLSAGGMCATMLALRHPTIYTAFGDYAGLTSPTVDEWVDPEATTNTLFGRSTAAYNAHDPLYLLAHNAYPTMGGWFEVGTADRDPLAAQQTLAPLAQQAGIATTAVEVPGAGHDFDLFAKAFADSLPFLTHRLGLTPAPAPAQA
jgi:S-formylglutathione hydrolase FrmB